MITSTTDLIDTIKEPRPDLDGALNHRTELSRQETADLENLKLYILHKNTMTVYYFRLSWQNKLRMMMSMLDTMRCLESLSLVFNILYSASGKMRCYAKIHLETDFFYDKVLFDNDRMLDSEFIDEQMRRDLDWYRQLEDIRQISIFINLLRLSGGAIILRLFEKTYTIFERRSRELKLLGQHQTPSTPETDKLPFLGMKHEVQETVNGPTVVQLLREQWRHLVTDYESSLRPMVPTTSMSTKSSINSDRKKHEKRKTKKEKKKKKKTKGKKGDNGNGNIDMDVDRIQLLPIQIVKRILNYLDEHTLKMVQQVNGYWKYAIGDLFEERKAKLKLSAIRMQILDLFPREVLIQDGGTIGQLISTKVRVPLSMTERRLRHLDWRGACAKHLTRIDDGNEPVRKCVISAVGREVGNECGFPIRHLTDNPRIIKTYATPLYVVPKLNCTD